MEDTYYDKFTSILLAELDDYKNDGVVQEGEGDDWSVTENFDTISPIDNKLLVLTERLCSLDNPPGRDDYETFEALAEQLPAGETFYLSHSVDIGVTGGAFKDQRVRITTDYEFEVGNDTVEIERREVVTLTPADLNSPTVASSRCWVMLPKR